MRSEKASIDEAFLDLTLMAIDRLLAIHPYLSEPPPDAPEGLDSPLPRPPPIDWTKAGNVFPLDGEESSKPSEHAEAGEGEGHMYSSQKSDDDHRPGGTENGKRPDRGVTWEDWALCLGAEIMAEVREEVWKRLHYTCSAGIAHSKAMSKVSTGSLGLPLYMSRLMLPPALFSLEETEQSDYLAKSRDSGFPA